MNFLLLRRVLLSAFFAGVLLWTLFMSILEEIHNTAEATSGYLLIKASPFGSPDLPYVGYVNTAL